ncbi:MAG: substrate-binding domain-containing protein [bacterium]
MQKIFSFMLITLLIFLLPLNQMLGSGNKAPAKKITIGFIGKIEGNPVFQAAFSGAKVAARELAAKNNIEITISQQSPATQSATEQAARIESLLSSGAAGIAIACSDQKIVAPAINKAMKAGIPVVCFDADAPTSKRIAYYGPNDVEFGRMLMKELSRELNGKGTIAILAGNPKALNLQRRLQGIKEELAKHPGITLPSKGVLYHQESPVAAVEALDRHQQANPNIKGWISIGSWPFNLKNSIKWKPGEVKLVAGNAVPSELAYVESGFIQALVGVNCFEMGYKSVEILVDKIVNNQVPATTIIYAPLTRVSKENFKEWTLNWRKWLIKEALN